MTPADQQTHVVAFTGRRNWETFHMNERNRAKPVAPYIGGKRNLAKRLCRVIDAHDHVTYAEPFVGMGGIFLRRAQPARAEFINDRSRDVYNLFRILQEHYVAFLDLLRFQITTQTGFERLLAVDPETLTDLQRAARFLYLQRMAFGGKVDKRTFGVSPDRTARFNLTTLEPDLEALHTRLSGVTVTNLDYAAFIARIDRPGALFYLDPPYFGCEGDYGKDAFGREDFARIADKLKTLKGDFILSINETPEILELFAWANIEPIKTTYSLGQKASTEAHELIITSLDLAWVQARLDRQS
ncbi:DNA methyltransferase [Roseobacter sp. OBYS 0001]|nr:DNA methyltransferase [Roseobacter sp. OBYS 0001]